MRQVLPAFYTMTARGASMNLAGINDGDHLCVCTTRRAREGDIVIAQVADEGVTTKRLAVNGWGTWLVAESDQMNWPGVLVDETIKLVGIVEGKLHPELGMVPLRPVPHVLVHQEPAMPRPLQERRRREIAQTLREAPRPAAPRLAYTQHVAQHPRGEDVMVWKPYAGMVGDHGRINPASAQQALVVAYGAEFSDFVVVAATGSMTGRGIEDGDQLFVKEINPRRLWGGLVVLADLGDMGTAVGELHEDGNRRFLRSNQGREWKDEMHIEIGNADIQGLVFLVGR